MAQEYEAVTTLLWVFGTETKIINKQEIFSCFFCFFLAHFEEMCAKQIVVTSHEFGEIKYSSNISSKSAQSQFYSTPQLFQIQK